MKDLSISSSKTVPFTPLPQLNAILAIFGMAAICILPAGQSMGANLLSNPSFEQNSGNNVPTGWTYFAPPSLPSGTKHYWIVDTNTVGCSHMLPEDGSLYWKEYGALYAPAPTNNVAGIYQTLSGSPGSIYQASGWLATSLCDQLAPDCVTWLQVEFLNSSSNVIGLLKSSNFSAAAGTDEWLQYSVTNACDLTQPVSTGDPYFPTYAVTGSVSQLVAPAGTAMVRYRYCYLQSGNEGGSAFLDNASLNQVSGSIPPAISGLYPPDTMIFVNPTNKITFNVSSPSGYTINTSGIHMTVNGTDVSGSLTIGGSASSKTVSYTGLQSNTAYAVSISVTDVSNLTATASAQFQTMWLGVVAPTYVWEAEDWDFTNGLYIDFPDLCNASGDPNCYFGKTGTQGVDENNTSGHSGPYRPDDLMGSGAAADALRPTLYASNRTDYAINPFNGNEWVNYTRDWPSGTFWLIGRVAVGDGFSGALTLSKVNADSSTTDIGTFSLAAGLGWTAFTNLYLLDATGNKALLTLNGKATLRLTSGGNMLPNFFMLVPAQADLPQLSNIYPTGTHPFEPTNTFSFTVTTLGSTFPANGITFNIDGNDVTSKLQISGTSSSNRVVYPNLLPNAIHSAVITATNALGHGIRAASTFDTFSENNFMVEAEDFDYGGGQYVDPWYPDAYSTDAPITNIDFQHITLANEQFFNYRPDGVPQDIAHDYLRQVFVDNIGSKDYILSYFGNTDWVNYTRVYPAGSFYVYGRLSGGSGINFTMYLDQVVSGATTTTQTTRRLGQWSALGVDYTTFGWVPLTDAGGVAPVVVNLNGLSTLRITTTGNSNPNFFMLVPTSGIRVTATRSGGNIVLSFSTQAGATYRVFSRSDLATGSWTLLTSVFGDGTVKSVSDTASAAHRFYKVSAP